MKHRYRKLIPRQKPEECEKTLGLYFTPKRNSETKSNISDQMTSFVVIAGLF